jgi:hypothetical protein
MAYVFCIAFQFELKEKSRILSKLEPREKQDYVDGQIDLMDMGKNDNKNKK